MKFLYHSYEHEPCYLPLLNISEGLAPGEVVKKEREGSQDGALGWELKTWIYFQFCHHPNFSPSGPSAVKGEQMPDSTHLPKAA